MTDGSPADLVNQRLREHELGRDLALTPRQRDILALIVTGASNDEIAGQLYLSINTVKTFVRTAYKKIGACSRAQAVAWGIEHGYPPNHAGTTAEQGRMSPASKART